MKKLFTLFGLALAMLTVGCTTGLNEEVTINEKVVIGVTIDEESRIEMIGSEGTTIKLGWSEGDCIYVNGVKSEPLAAGYDGKPQAQFVIPTLVTKPYKVVYAPKLVGEEGDVVIPENRTFEEAGLGAVFAGQSETTSVSLKAAVGFVAVTFTGVPTATCDISIKAASGEYLSGSASYDFENEALTLSSGLPTINFAGVPVDEGEAVCVFPVPAAAYATGFVVSVAAGETEMIKTIGATTGYNIKPASAVLMPELAYAGTPRALTIKNAADLQAFLTAVDAGDYAAYVNGMGEVLLANDIDLAGVTLQGSTITGAEKSFKHTFNGQGHSLKNWNITSALFAQNRGTIKNFIIDESCTWTPALSGEEAIVALKNYGVISGITSNVDVIMDGATMSGTIKLGSMVASSYAAVYDCVNNGDFKITNLNWTGGNIYFGAVVSYAWYKTGEDLLANCVNNGDIEWVCADGIVGKNFYLGGVFGCTQLSKYNNLTEERNVGILYNCVNNGDILCQRKALDAGSYADIGGVVGYMDGDMINCVNNGKVAYVGVNDNTGDKASTRPCVGGVVAVCTFSMENCINYGEVVMEGTFAAGGGNTTDACGASGNPCFGGVVGQAGNHKCGGELIDGCVNYGKISFNSTMRPANATALQIGGVIGLTNSNVSNCENHGEFNVQQNFGTTYVGGVVGRLYQQSIAVENCHNTAVTNLVPLETTKNTQIYLGGVVGHGKNCPITNCSNEKDVNVAAGHLASANSYIGGIIGQGDGGNCSVEYGINYGNLTVLSSTKWRAGGIAGCTAGNIVNCYHDGDVTVANNDAGCVGGLNGFGQANITDSQAYGTLTTSASSPCGGLVGQHGNTAQNWNGNKIKVNIVAEGAYCGIMCGDNTASGEGKISVIGDTKVNLVFGGMTINGVAVTEADCADLTKLYGHIATDGWGILGEQGVRFIPAN